MKIIINKKNIIDTSKKPLIIAEISSNHNGNKNTIFRVQNIVNVCLKNNVKKQLLYLRTKLLLQ